MRLEKKSLSNKLTLRRRGQREEHPGNFCQSISTHVQI